MTRAVLVVLMAAGAARGQAVAVPAGQKGAVIFESAVVIWDAPGGVEHLVRSIEVEASADSAGLLLASPTRPELSPTAGGLFDEALRRATKPRLERRRRLARPGDTTPPVQPPPDAPLAAVPPVAPGPPAGAVLDPAAVPGWLAHNDLAGRPALSTWLAARGLAGESVTAVRLHIDRQTLPKLSTGWHRPVRLTFPTARPVVPSLAPADAVDLAPGGARRLNQRQVFVLAEARYEPAAGPTPVRWAGLIDRPTFEYTAAACGLPPAEVDRLASRDWTLTEWHDQSPAGAAADLVYVRAADQSPVWRPPTVVYEDVYWPYYALSAGGLVGGPVAFWVLWRAVRRAIRHLPAAPLD